MTRLPSPASWLLVLLALASLASSAAAQTYRVRILAPDTIPVWDSLTVLPRLRIDAIAIKTARVSTAKGWTFTIVGSGWVATDEPPRRRWYVAQGKLPKQKAIRSDTLRVPVTWGSACWFARLATRGVSLGTTITIAPKDAFGIAEFCAFRGDTAQVSVVTP